MDKKILENTPFRIQIMIGPGLILKEAVERLDIGDVLMFEQSIQEPFKIKIEDKVLFAGYPGLWGEIKAVRIYERIRENAS